MQILNLISFNPNEFNMATVYCIWSKSLSFFKIICPHWKVKHMTPGTSMLLIDPAYGLACKTKKCIHLHFKTWHQIIASIRLQGNACWFMIMFIFVFVWSIPMDNSIENTWFKVCKNNADILWREWRVLYSRILKTTCILKYLF